MDTEVYFFHQGYWFKTRVALPDAELNGTTLTEPLWSACGLDPKLLPVFKVSQAAITENLRKAGHPPVGDKDLGSAHLVLDHTTYGTLKLQPDSLQGQALVVLLPSAWGSTLGGPWLAPPSWAHCERLFACYEPAENHPFIYELALACGRIWPGSVQVPEDASRGLGPHPGAPVHDSGTQGLALLRVPNGGSHSSPWAQDAFQVGYCCDFTQSKQTAVALRFPSEPRGAPGDSTPPGVPELLPACNDILLAEQSGGGIGQNHGGNVLVSPPVSLATAALEADEAGPAVSPHPPAPLGKLVVGDSHAGRMGPRTRQWLRSQRLQPVLPVDTSWLSSGHVDEVVTFLKAQDDSFKTLIADPGRMVELHGLLSREEQAHLPPRYQQLDDEPFRSYNEALQRGRFAELRERLKRGLALEDESFIPIPVAFIDSDNKSAASTINLVNLQLINGHALVPKPLGPRVSPHRASKLMDELGLGQPHPGEGAEEKAAALQRKETEVLEQVTRELEKTLMAEPGTQHLKIDLKGTAGYWIWATVGTDANQIAHEHACSREALLEKNAQRFDAHGQVTSGFVRDERKDEFTRFNRLWIPSETVDVLECYMKAVLEPLGYAVHFIDTSAIHASHGELRRGSNAQRALPQGWDLSTSQRLWTELSLHDLSYRID